MKSKNENLGGLLLWLVVSIVCFVLHAPGAVNAKSPTYHPLPKKSRIEVEIWKTAAAMPKDAIVPIDLVLAMGWKESSWNDNPPLGDAGLACPAYGFLQIRQPICDDINEKYGTHFVAQKCQGDRPYSLRVCDYAHQMYIDSKIGHIPPKKAFARIWNGGKCGCYDHGVVNARGSKTTYIVHKSEMKGRTPQQIAKMKAANVKKSLQAQQKLAETQKRAEAYWVDVDTYLAELEPYIPSTLVASK